MHKKALFVGNSDDMVKEDPIKMIRVIRVATELRCKIPKETKKVIIENSKLINMVDPERIKKEIEKIFETKNVSSNFYLLQELGILKHILPEVERLFDCKQSARYHSEGNVFVHTMMVLDNLKLKNKITPNKCVHFYSIFWAALFHDIGKPETSEINSSGDISNNGHDHVGAKLFLDIAQRYNFSNEETDYIYNIINEHMAFHKLKEMKISKAKRLIKQPFFTGLKAVCFADKNSSFPMDKNDVTSFPTNEEISEYIKYLKEQMKTRHQKKPLITGKHLINLGFEPSKLFSIILNDVSELHYENILINKKDAIKYILEKYKKNV